MSEMHTLSVLVENKPGVLTRVAALFARRSFNIRSLAVGETEVPEISRITVVVDAETHPLEQVTKQLNKLECHQRWLTCQRCHPCRQLVLFKVQADEKRRTGASDRGFVPRSRC